MTNWKTISNSISRLKGLHESLEETNVGLTKKELLRLTRERDKLERALGGIKDMGALPDILFIIDTNKESLAVAEANRLNIPVVGVIDSNSSPEGIDYPIPGNDDSLRSIKLYCSLVAESALAGIREEITHSGGDLGESEAPVEPDIPEENEEVDNNIPKDTTEEVGVNLTESSGDADSGG
tara:strand:- start:2382 stop:2924 length:543 start_codon:yes stop_codon:yes gene_type:complete